MSEPLTVVATSTGVYTDKTPSATGYAYIPPGTQYPFPGPLPENTFGMTESVHLLGPQPTNNTHMTQTPTPPGQVTPSFVTNTEHPPGTAHVGNGGHLKVDTDGVMSGIENVGIGVGLHLFPSKLPGLVEGVGSRAIETVRAVGGRPVQQLIDSVAENPLVARGMDAYRARVGNLEAPIQGMEDAGAEVEPLLEGGIEAGVLDASVEVGAAETVGALVGGIVSAPAVVAVAATALVGYGAYEIGQHVSWGGETLNQHVSDGFRRFSQFGDIFHRH
jgi:hypothetical protein